MKKKKEKKTEPEKKKKTIDQERKERLASCEKGAPELMPKKKKKDPEKKRELKGFSKIITPHLIKGDATYDQIAKELVKKFPGTYDEKRFKSNVHARVVGYRRQGWEVVKDDKGKVKVIPPAKKAA